MKRIFALIVFTAFAAVMFLPSTAPVTAGSSAQDRGPDYVPGEMLVQFKAGVDVSEINRVLGRGNAVAAEVVREALANGPDRGELILARFPANAAFASVRRSIEDEPTVEFAEPNWIYTHQATSNDPLFTNGSLWGMYGATTSPGNQYGSGAANAWASGKTDCSSVYVGIIDEGYMYTHPDLSANVGINPREIAGNGKDDDLNGYVDDVYGWDFDGNNNTVFDGVDDDHGTHVAGTIGAQGGNAIGVAGVCWSVKMMSAKFLGKRGGTTANAVKAVDYFTTLKTVGGMNFVATNNSWGGGGFSQALSDAISRANNAGILFIAAAGNSSYNCDTSTACYPAEYTSPNVVAVASITSSGAMSSFSNYGATTVDIGAPGSGIYSTLPVRSSGSVVPGYGSYSGTSMAAPHVSGAAALYAAYHAGASADSIKAALLNGTPTASLAGKTATGDRLNVSGF